SERALAHPTRARPSPRSTGTRRGSSGGWTTSDGRSPAGVASKAARGSLAAAPSALGEVFPARERVRLAVQAQVDALARLDAADRDTGARMGRFVFASGEQLEVLAEPEIVDRRAGGERDAVEVDHEANARPPREMAGVDRDPVRDVEHRVGDPR